MRGQSFPRLLIMQLLADERKAENLYKVLSALKMKIVVTNGARKDFEIVKEG